MARPNFFIRLSPSEENALNLFLKGGYKPHGLRARRRAQAVWFSHQGRTISKIAEHFGINERNIRKWFKTYQEKGLDGLKGKYFSFGLRH